MPRPRAYVRPGSTAVLADGLLRFSYRTIRLAPYFKSRCARHRPDGPPPTMHTRIPFNVLPSGASSALSDVAFPIGLDRPLLPWLPTKNIVLNVLPKEWADLGIITSNIKGKKIAITNDEKVGDVGGFQVRITLRCIFRFVSLSPIIFLWNWLREGKKEQKILYYLYF